MAHECPDCGLTCHCNGDIDDCLMNDEEDVMMCTHCPFDDEGDFDGDDDEYDLDTDCGEIEPEGR